GNVLKETARVVSANLVFDGVKVRVDQAQVQTAHGTLVATGSLEFKAQAFQVEGRVDNVDLGNVLAAAGVSGLDVTCVAGCRFEASGSIKNIDDLNVRINAEGHNVTFNGREAGQLSLTARTGPDGRIDAELITGFAGKPQQLHGSVELRRTGRPI